VREATKVPCEPKTASAKAMWVAKSTTSSLDAASYEAKIVLDHETISASCRAKPRLARKAKAKVLYAKSKATVASLTSTTLLSSARPVAHEAKAKASLSANSVVDSASLPLRAPSAKNLCREAINKAPLGANNEAILTSLEGKALHNKAKFTSKDRTKAAAWLCNTTPSGDAILASPIIKKKAFKAKPKASQPKKANFQSLEIKRQVSKN